VCVLHGSHNLGHGATSFDSFPWALLNAYVVVSLSNVVDVALPLWDATSWAAGLYFLALILLGGFFAVNVFVVRGFTCMLSGHGLHSVSISCLLRCFFRVCASVHDLHGCLLHYDLSFVFMMPWCEGHSFV
jgi:hypothetical protein